MKIGDRTCVLCQCEGTLPIDSALLGQVFGQTPRPGMQLCRAEVGRLRAMGAEGPLLVGCTQEQTVLGEALRSEGADGADLIFTNIRERAGWSAEGAEAGPKIAALLAEAALPPSPGPGLALTSEGRVVVLARDEAGLGAAVRLGGRLDVTVLMRGRAEVTPPRDGAFPVLRGAVRNAKGHLGAFELEVDGFAAPKPSSRAVLEFGPARNGVTIEADVILDLSGEPPLFPAAHARDGYLRADPASPVAVLEAVLAAADLEGSFDRPRFIEFTPDLCAHSRNRRTGCTRCLDVCPTGAITPDGDHVTIDPYVCAGCGACHAVCPTGAATYAQPGPFALLERVRLLLGTYLDAGGKAPVLLIHDAGHGRPLIDLLARLGPGLPARVIPMEVGEVTALGIEAFAFAMAFGAAEVRVLGPARPRIDTATLRGLVEMADGVLQGLGFGEGRVALIETDDPEELGSVLYGLERREGAARPETVLPFGEKRDLMKASLRSLHAVAPEPVDALALPAGAPFGRIEVDVDGCTMCFSCFNVCPSGAISDHPEKPQLSFLEDACVQCGLCANTCPENVITLVPEFRFTEEARTWRVLKEEEPALCISCGKAFGVRSSVERVIAKLSGNHWMYSGPVSAIDRMRMCADCRAVAHARSALDPYAGPPRPRPVTADDLKR